MWNWSHKNKAVAAVCRFSAAEKGLFRTLHAFFIPVVSINDHSTDDSKNLNVSSITLIVNTAAADIINLEKQALEITHHMLI